MSSIFEISYVERAEIRHTCSTAMCARHAMGLAVMQ